jgi:phosphonate degradation associated HDIG domain protein
MHPSIDCIEHIERLFALHGHRAYAGEAVTQMEHALQCATLAAEEGGSLHEITAGLLHDLGHLVAHERGLLESSPTQSGINDAHEQLAPMLLAGWMPPEVTGPIALHVQAKRYLVSADPGYLQRLSPDSLRSLQLQGGPLSTADCEAFLQGPFSVSALNLRRRDDRAKTMGKSTPTLDALLSRIDTAYPRVRVATSVPHD